MDGVRASAHWLESAFMRAALLALLIAATAFLGGCGGMEAAAAGKILRIPIPTDGPHTLDPVRGSTTYENRVCSHIYEGLLQYKYLKRPYELEPALAEAMPERSEDGRTYTFRLKKGVHFQDNKCFPGGKGREVLAKDFFYSWRRMADKDNDPKSWWLFADTIVGFDDYRKAQNEADEFDYDAPVEGFKLFADDPHKLQVVLKEPVTPFLYILAMFQTYVVPREAAEHYGEAFARNPVGTGPYMVRRHQDWVVGQKLTLYRNPTYRPDFYPKEWDAEDEALGLHLAAGKKLPFADRIDLTFFVQPQTQWLEFASKNLGFTTVAAENFGEAFVKRTRKLRKRWREKGVTAWSIPLLDFIFRGFNMDDPVVGGYTDKRRALRRALHLAVDQVEFNDAFYNGINVIYDGPIPPALVGHPDGHLIEGANQGPDIDRARAELKKAGFPDGKGTSQTRLLDQLGRTGEGADRDAPAPDGQDRRQAERAPRGLFDVDRKRPTRRRLRCSRLLGAATTRTRRTTSRSSTARTRRPAATATTTSPQSSTRCTSACVRWRPAPNDARSSCRCATC